MPANQNNKMKILKLLQLFKEKTDEAHGITIEQIISELDKDGIHAERKSLYDDIKAINELNMPGIFIESKRVDRTTVYYLREHHFSQSELRILVDAVAASRFLTDDLARKITGKVEMLGSIYQSTSLKRNVYISDRPKSMNESVFENINIISKAISSACKIAFEYADWNQRKELVKREVNGDKTDISPCFLELYDGNYYLVSIDDTVNQVRHYRVDKMQRITLKNDKISEQATKIRKMSPASYSSKLTGMYSGEIARISLLVKKEKIGIVIDKFGKDSVTITPFPENGCYTCMLEVEVSDLLLGWLAAVSDYVTIKSPESVKEQYKKMLQDALDKI